MEIKDCMKRAVYSIHKDASVWQAAQVFIERHIGLLPVVDSADKPVGVIGMRDLVELVLPSFFHLIEDVDFVHDFGAIESEQPPAALLEEPVSKYMRRITVVKENSGLVRAYSLMLQKDLHDLPVVSAEGKLTGIASRVDLGVAILKTWRRT